MTKSTSPIAVLCGIYLLSLLPYVPNGVFVGTFILSVGVVLMAKYLRLGFLAALGLVVAGYVLQDVAHLVTGEKTFQQSYTAGGDHFSMTTQWFEAFAEHTYYLLPLCIHIAIPVLEIPTDIMDILTSPIPCQMQQLHTYAMLLAPLMAFTLGSYCLDSKNTWCFFPGAPYFYRVLQCSLHDGTPEVSRASDLSTIRSWVMSTNPKETQSSHWWYKSLEGGVKHAFDRCAGAPQVYSKFRELFSERHYAIDIVTGMNEIYVTGPTREEEVHNSDHVFYTQHVDGPFGFIPFASVYRCIVGMDRNMMITTHFPLANLASNACAGDVLAFDFNREVHYITKDDTKRADSDDFRVVLKLHYCVYPRVLAPIGWLLHFLNVKYNQMFRALFLKTINPNSVYEHFLAWNVVTNTTVYNSIEKYIGIRNILYLAYVSAMWWATNSYFVFFGLTSFAHYIRYITTFYYRKEIDFGSFKRDVLLFKTLALSQLIYHYLFPSTTAFVFDPISVGMILTGYVVSIMATNALGVDRTYFGAELGLMEPKWVTQFPYGYIPHPMIVSQVFALLGFMKAAHFRAEWPLVVPIHCALYMTHMLQEHFDIYKRYPENEKPVNNTTPQTVFINYPEAANSTEKKQKKSVPKTPEATSRYSLRSHSKKVL
jgi:hypothetical protein